MDRVKVVSAALAAMAMLLPGVARSQAGQPAAPAAKPAGPVLREVWRRPLDGGLGRLVVAGGRVYASAADEQSEVLVALDARDGKEVWRAKLGPKHPAREDGSSSTPSIDGAFVYVVSSDCRLHALKAATGEPAWQQDLKAKFGTGPMRRGCETTPVVDGDRLLVLASGEAEHRLVALAKSSGELAWTSKAGERSVYTSPVVADIGGVRQVVVHQLRQPPQQQPVSGLYGVSAADGSLLWSTMFDGGLSFDSPLVLPDGRVSLSTWQETRLFKVAEKAGQWSAEQVWASPDLRADIAEPVAHGGLLFGFGGEHLAAVDAATGKTAWKERTYGGSLALADGSVVVLSRDAGLLRLIEPTAAGYKETARLEVLEPGATSQTPPTVDGRRIYLRNLEEVVAVEVGG